MDSDHVVVLLFGLLLVGTAVAVVYASPLAFGGEADGGGGGALASFETSEPVCGDPNATRSATLTRDVATGQAVVINGSVPVASNDTRVDATFEAIGPQRYLLSLSRETPAETATVSPSPTETRSTGETRSTTEGSATTDEITPTPTTASTESPAVTTAPTADTATAATSHPTRPLPSTSPATSTRPSPPSTLSPSATATAAPSAAECFLEVRYAATIVVAQPREYTVVVTVDGALTGAYWRDGEETGSYDRIPVTPAAPANETAAG